MSALPKPISDVPRDTRKVEPSGSAVIRPATAHTQAKQVPPIIYVCCKCLPPSRYDSAG
jgi:hypothetical protein